MLKPRRPTGTLANLTPPQASPVHLTLPLALVRVPSPARTSEAPLPRVNKSPSMASHNRTRTGEDSVHRVHLEQFTSAT